MVALDATNVYWVDVEGGEIATAPKDGGDVRVLSSGETGPVDVIVHGSVLEWAAWTNEAGSMHCGLCSVQKDGQGRACASAGPTSACERMVVDQPDAFGLGRHRPLLQPALRRCGEGAQVRV
jgi:hypothetical protein